MAKPDNVTLQFGKYQDYRTLYSCMCHERHFIMVRSYRNYYLGNVIVGGKMVVTGVKLDSIPRAIEWMEAQRGIGLPAIQPSDWWITVPPEVYRSLHPALETILLPPSDARLEMDEDNGNIILSKVEKNGATRWELEMTPDSMNELAVALQRQAERLEAAKAAAA